MEEDEMASGTEREKRRHSRYLLLGEEARDNLHASGFFQEPARGFDPVVDTHLEPCGKGGIQVRQKDFENLVESVKQAVGCRPPE
jgi:hypothetical protein